ncbi:hypothetical protein OAA18_00655, partial [bacterium]|nr:hypothetical protein [bacterium]
GPDEDNRYIIGKDVPTMDHPTSTPEGNIGSVRFWGTDTKDDNDFLLEVNRIPGTQGLPAFTNPNNAYNWLVDNGYFTNYLPSFQEFTNYFIYDRPATNSSLSNSLLYSTSQNKLYVQPRVGEIGDGDQYFANFQIGNFSSTLVDGNTYYYSGSAYSGSTTITWLEAPIIQPSGIPDRDSTRTVGPMAINSAGTRLFVQSINNSSYNGTEERGLIQYDITQNPPTVLTIDYDGLAARNAVPRTVDYESTSQMLFFTWRRNNDLDYVADVTYVDNVNDEFVYQGTLKDINGNLQNKINSVTPGPSNIVLATTQDYNPRYFIYDMSGTSPLTAISQSDLDSTGWYPSIGTRENWFNTPPVYIPQKNAWFFGFQRGQFSLGENKIVKIQDSHPYTLTNFAEIEDQPTSFAKAPRFLAYDSTRDIIWTNGTDNILVGIDAESGYQKYTTNIQLKAPIYDNGTYNNRGAFIKNDKLIYISNQEADGTAEPPKHVAAIDLSNLVPDG